MQTFAPTTATHCPYCALQCGMNLILHENALEVQPRDFPTNNGGLCRKGWTSTDLLAHPERLLSPLVRRNGVLQNASWDEALSFIANAIIAIQEKSGKDKIGVFGGGGLTNEKAYLLGKFARVALQTPHIDYNGRYCMSSAAGAGIKAFGIDRGLPFPLEDIPRAETILLVGSNIAETMPPIMQWFEKQRENGGHLIVVDPRSTPTAKAASLFLQIVPGTDLALANGLLHIAIRDKLIDENFIQSRTTGWEEVKRTVASYWPDRVESMTGIAAEKLEEAAHLLGEAKTAMVLTARGPEQQSKGVDTVLGFINLALALGKAGKPFCGYGCLTGQGNGQGGREHGQKSDQLPGYRKIDNPVHRAHIAKVWGVDESTLPGAGQSAYELLDAMGTPDGVRALLVFASNIAVSSPNVNRMKERLRALDLLVVADIFLSETAQLADVVLPVTQWAEEDGTMTNLEGRVLRRRQATLPPDGVKSDAEIIEGISSRLGYGKFFTSRPREIWEELRLASAGGAADYNGISYERIEKENGVFWPCPDEKHAGTPRLFLDKFGREDGRALFHAVAHRDAGEEPCAQYPLFFTTGRVLAQYQSGAQTRRVKALNEMNGVPFLEIHPALAAQLEIEDDEEVRVLSRRGEAFFAARYSLDIRRDTIFAPFHWGGKNCANLLTNPALDPTSKMPEFKICAVKIEKII